jgi:predicted Zn-dependent protease
LLKVQGAKVAVLDGKAQEALKVANEVLSARPEDVAAQLVQIEALLAMGKIDDAKRTSDTLRNEYPADAWGWIFGGAVAAAQGQARDAVDLLEQAAELAGTCPCTHEERLAISWARTLKQGQQISPRSRAEEQKVATRAAPSPTPAPQETSKEPR